MKFFPNDDICFTLQFNRILLQMSNPSHTKLGLARLLIELGVAHPFLLKWYQYAHLFVVVVVVDVTLSLSCELDICKTDCIFPRNINLLQIK
jgi:hypothetical protein